ncbi:MAG: hypothetical protein COZ15_02650 [Elusimicrobia bacterium CG_4_10_14_3_um_filter_49_12_50_7]|nr:MAG: hypothetical protein COZ15_02650 [Elusimicrobia bacterium CG_4_10_14_3_um_filter_49_12_50_7]
MAAKKFMRDSGIQGLGAQELGVMCWGLQEKVLRGAGVVCRGRGVIFSVLIFSFIKFVLFVYVVIMLLL